MNSDQTPSETPPPAHVVPLDTPLPYTELVDSMSTWVLEHVFDLIRPRFPEPAWVAPASVTLTNIVHTIMNMNRIVLDLVADDPTLSRATIEAIMNQTVTDDLLYIEGPLANLLSDPEFRAFLHSVDERGDYRSADPATEPAIVLMDLQYDPIAMAEDVRVEQTAMHAMLSWLISLTKNGVYRHPDGMEAPRQRAVTSEEAADEECVCWICLERYEETGEMVTVMPCVGHDMHFYHPVCIGIWIASKGQKCPVNCPQKKRE